MKTRLLCTALAALSACASVSHDALTPVSVLRHENLRLVVERAAAGLRSATEAATWTEAGAGGPLVTLTLKLYAIEPELLSAALARRGGGLVAVACPRADAQRLEQELARLGAQLVRELGVPTKLTQHSGQRSCISIAKQVAYIAAFEIVSTLESAIADPRIEVASEGVLFTADARHDAAAGSIAVDLELTVCDLERPLAEHHLEVFPGAAPVTIQAPTGISRRLSAHTDLAPDESFLFGGSALPVDGRGRVLIALLEAELSSQAP